LQQESYSEENEVVAIAGTGDGAVVIRGPGGERNGGADYGGGDGAAGAQLDAGVAQQFGVEGEGAHITSPLEMRE
jgi:N-acetylglucosamine kinase-like BadF-type ATPase